MSKFRTISDILTTDASGNLLHIVEIAGPSGETKPTAGIANGSLCLETDTGLISVYDEDDGWGTAQ